MNVLICFAVREEARFFQAPAGCRVLITGVGAKAAGASIIGALATDTPELVLTCGYAGALNPAILPETLLFETTHAPAGEALRALGARPSTFLCLERVVTTSGEKTTLHRQSGADAVEMESGIIRQYCAEASVPCATLRVISDAAVEDLPLDFNVLISPEGSIRLRAVMGQLVKRPQAIPGLIRLQQRTTRAARVLGHCLEELLRRLAS